MRKYLLWLVPGVVLAALIIPLALGTPPVQVAAFVSPLLMIAIPLALWIALARSFRRGWRLFLTGALTFILSQVLHLPFNTLVLNPLFEAMGWQALPGSAGLAFISILAGLSAGLFENITRYLVLRFRAREERDWEQGMLFGAGHGGGEAIILGALSLVTFLRVLALRGVDLSALVPAEQLAAVRAQLDAYWNTPWYLFLLAPWERIVAICLHLCATLLVVRSLAQKNLVWLLAAILLHAFLDAFAVFSNVTWGPLAAEAGLTLIGLACVTLILYLRPKMQPTPAPDQGAPVAGNEAITSTAINPADPLTREQIDASRFG